MTTSSRFSSSAGAASRESARQGNGQFGTQMRGEADVDLGDSGGFGGLSVVPDQPALTPVQQQVFDSGASVGSRYDGSDVADIAKSTRAEIKKMRAAGEVPPEWKISVRSSRWGGGSAVDVAVEGVETTDHYVPAYNDTIQRPSASGAIALGKIEDYLESHNYDRSSSGSSGVHFYPRVTANGGNAGRWTRDVCGECEQYRPCSC